MEGTSAEAVVLLLGRISCPCEDKVSDFFWYAQKKQGKLCHKHRRTCYKIFSDVP